MNTILKIILAVLVVIAVVLGYKIYEKKAEPAAPVTTTTNSTATKSDVVATTTPKTGTTTSVKTTSSIPKPPAAGASNEELRTWGEFISKAAVPSTKLDISMCKPNPAVIALDKGTTFSITNSDSVAHTIVLNPTTSIKIEANSTKSTKADFGKGAGMYAYACDNQNEPVGVFLVK